MQASKESSSGFSADALYRDNKQLIYREPFYGLALTRINRFIDDKTKDIRLIYNPKQIKFSIAVNLEWYFGFKLDTRLELMKQVLLHFLFSHMTMFKKERAANDAALQIAMKVEVNQHLNVANLPDTTYKVNDPQFDKFWSKDDTKKGTIFYYERIKDYFDSFDEWGSIDLIVPEDQETMAHSKIFSILQEVSQSVKKTHGSVPGFVEELIERYSIPETNIHFLELLKRCVTAAVRKGMRLSRHRPSRRFEGGMGSVSSRRPRMLVFGDTSGSMSKKDLVEMLNYLYFMDYQGIDYDFVHIDTDIFEPPTTAKKINFDKMTFKGRGGTSFDPAMEFFNKHQRDYAGAIYITDGYCSPPSVLISKPLIWLITEDGADPNSLYFPGTILKVINNATS